MENFTAFNPTTLHFGKHVLTALVPTLKQYGKKVLMVYGQGSIKRSGLHTRLEQDLNEHGLEFVEYAGIRSNPVLEDVEAATVIGRQQEVDMILAVGGGSVIDSAKAVAVTIPVNHSAWDFYTGKATPKKALPVITILTLAATGSEMNAISVISNKEAGLKLPIRSTLIFPKHSFLDPELTTTVPKDYTAYGIADLMAHAMEAWFGAGNCPMSDKLVLAILKEAMEAGPPLLQDLFSYELRARIMYAATLALNGITMQGKISGDWGVHAIGHVLSLLYDIPHGASLTIVYPAWMRFFRHQAEERIVALAKGMFGDTMDAETAISRIEDFFLSLDCPVKLRDWDIAKLSLDDIRASLEKSKANGAAYKLKPQDYTKIIDLMI